MILDYIMAIIGTAAITAIFVSYYWASETIDWNNLYFKSCRMQSHYEDRLRILELDCELKSKRLVKARQAIKDLDGLLEDARYALLDPDYVENPVLYLDLGYYLNATIIDGKYSNQGEENASNPDRRATIARWESHQREALS